MPSAADMTIEAVGVKSYGEQGPFADDTPTELVDLRGIKQDKRHPAGDSAMETVGALLLALDGALPLAGSSQFAAGGAHAEHRMLGF